MEKTIKIAITGPESTGKSTLSKELALHFGGALVPEYARFYLEKNGPAYTLADIERIAHIQKAHEELYASEAPSYLFCDTDMLVYKIWAEFVFGTCPKAIEKLESENHYDLTLLMNTDLPWEPDPLREHPDKRDELLALYKKGLAKRKFILISGSGNQRVQNAIEAIQSVFNSIEN